MCECPCAKRCPGMKDQAQRRGGMCEIESVWKERLGEEWLCVGVYRREGYVCI